MLHALAIPIRHPYPRVKSFHAMDAVSGSLISTHGINKALLLALGPFPGLF